ncbi:hypothetical protein KY998_23830 [Bacillus paralicheniformis]|nr:hypothetical protein [Bacillus paralicheniformis]MCJ8221573.1 hypothetical protein [Bacillus paralicheniformis]MCM3424406.1 hypothetical protein [Bacillus paralicheniformis]MCY7462288.1 hypothetical protein [Bacillus paralicheniformis]UJG57604.1 hypothetical protein KY998_23830 [Bacillus paralicheniformis]WEZ26559.1 hypothetical protein P5637_12715 [Bacillus paralicheniformis]
MDEQIRSVAQNMSSSEKKLTYLNVKLTY